MPFKVAENGEISSEEEKEEEEPTFEMDNFFQSTKK
jgi:hypothetical protein